MNATESLVYFENGNRKKCKIDDIAGFQAEDIDVAFHFGPKGLISQQYTEFRGLLALKNGRVSRVMFITENVVDVKINLPFKTYIPLNIKTTH